MYADRGFAMAGDPMSSVLTCFQSNGSLVGNWNDCKISSTALVLGNVCTKNALNSFLTRSKGTT